MTLQSNLWQTPPSQPILLAGEVHLWRFPLDCTDSLEDLLEEDELFRAHRLLVPSKARAFVVARARLRQILARYLDVVPENLRFQYGPLGKPVLVSQAADGLAFNLAHSGRWGLCAVAKGIEVGVDIERIDRQLDYEKLAAGFFSARERDSLKAGSSNRKRRQFFRIWTRKEAWLKGKGGGFSDPDQDLAPAHLAGSFTHDGAWWIKSIPVARNYLAALALSQECSLLRRWNG